jgi:hypothetical protein
MNELGWMNTIDASIMIHNKNLRVENQCVMLNKQRDVRGRTIYRNTRNMYFPLNDSYR